MQDKRQGTTPQNLPGLRAFLPFSLAPRLCLPLLADSRCCCFLLASRLRASLAPRSECGLALQEVQHIYARISSCLTCSSSGAVFGVPPERLECSEDEHGNSIPTALLTLQRRLYSLGGLQVRLLSLGSTCYRCHCQA